MATVNVYLTFNGKCEAAFNFYKSVFGGEFTFIGKFNEMENNEENLSKLNPEEGNRIMHVTLPISAETSLMGSDTSGEWSSKLIEGNNYSVSINTSSLEEADRLFEGLSFNGLVTMPMNHTFWGAYFGMFTDQFGIHWMVNFDPLPEN
jgi:PhnB protein